MEYPYFNAGPPQGYPFLGLPLTPAHSGSANSDDFNNSPPVGASSPVANPIPWHDQKILTPRSQDASNFDFQTFDAYQQHYNANALPLAEPQTPLSLDQKPPIGTGAGSGFDHNIDHGNDATQRGSNSDDDDNRTPAQSRRKAQNRAAQRAFRERKERHVKDLEAKLATLEKQSATVVEENERLKLQLQKTATENEILKATSAQPRGGSEPLPNAGPMRYSPTDFYTEVLYAHENKVPSHRIVTSDTGERLLAAGAAWDYIIKHDLYVRGLVDVGAVSERLKTVAKCDGQGPVFEERAIIAAIESSVASGNDELL
ncbi:uncharacterized protein BP5553_06759 [Venustampulla echinocandica]|uniref:BZIP domain-containing protein n=1 Tax=Venustampulla echinocandica TaxID=2656787 RepID=A0A370TKX2_9HELO|nr:uncharacterized protein BP5553_06759 [Venustampulla echinocandica]RDL36147.1 hypothetical protein BP5553_06759 [Venustampulla echinocandica]